MKILKFVGETGPIQVYYLTEGLNLTDDQEHEIVYRHVIEEILHLHAPIGSIYNYALTETLSLMDQIAFLELLFEQLNFTDLEERWGWGYFLDQMNLGDTVSRKMAFSITIDENLGLAESGTVNLGMVDYHVTWRSRTREPGLGYGKSGYGIVSGYGDGDCIDLKSFRVKVYNAKTSTLKRNVVINIADTQNPDDDADYIYTSAMNISDNTVFEPNIMFEIFQIDQNDEESPAASIDIEPIPI